MQLLANRSSNECTSLLLPQKSADQTGEGEQTVPKLLVSAKLMCAGSLFEKIDGMST